MILNGVEKSALLLMSIGSDQAAEILKNLTPIEVKDLITSMVNIQQYSTDTMKRVLSECYHIATKTNFFNHDNSDNYLIDMLTKALGEKNGSDLLQKALDIRNSKACIEVLNTMKPQKAAVLLEQEHPQIITIILICLNKNQAGEILSFFSSQKRAEIVLRIIEFNGIEESRLIELTRVIDELMKSKKLILSNKGGVKIAAKILNTMKIKDESKTIKSISILNKSLAEKIIKEIFSFNNIVDVDDEYIKFVITHVDQEKLYIALQNTNTLIREKFFKNMSKADSHELFKSLEKKSYISHIAIENEQKLILMMIKNISNDKKISLKKLGQYYA